jgi:hypothetical protein
MSFWKKLMPERFIEVSFEKTINNPALVIDEMNSNTFNNESINIKEASLKEIGDKGISYQKTQGHSEHYKHFIS